MLKPVTFIFKIISIVCLNLFLVVINEANSQNETTPDPSIAEISLEEQLLYKSEFLPLFLAERSRQSALSWRGMPPGFLKYEFENIQLVHPLWGYWDNQLISIELAGQPDLDFGNLVLQFKAKTPDISKKPISRVVYSQDFVFGLSYLDVELIRYYNPQSYFRLGGNNILRNGSFPEYTSTQVNSYRFQIYHQLTKKWHLDLWYLQLRHKFKLGEFPFLDFYKKIHRVGQVFSMSLNFLPDSAHSFRFIPYAYKWGDRYNSQYYTERRNTELYSLGLKLKSDLEFKWGYLNFLGDIVNHKINESIHFRSNSQAEGFVKTILNPRFGYFWLKLGGGYHHLSKIGGSSIYNFGFGWKANEEMSFKFEAVNEVSNLPLSALFWKSDSITSLLNPTVPQKQGITILVKFPLTKGIYLGIEPFYQKFQNGWNFEQMKNSFVQSNIHNSGISTKFHLVNKYFKLKNDFTYNNNYGESYIPQVNNIVTLNVPLAMFKRALKLDGFLIYHYVGKLNLLAYDPFVNQYDLTHISDGNFHILDFKLLAHVKSATIFFVWENSLSQDYKFVGNYTEFFRIFRFGINWNFFN